jgi:hypothetical protein
LTENPAKPKWNISRGIDRRLWRGCSLYLSYHPSESKRDVGPISCRDTLLFEFPFQDTPQRFCIRSFMLGRSCVLDDSAKAAQLSMNGINWLHDSPTVSGRL